MKVLLLGSGGREHALAWKINQSPLLDRLYVAPGNAGTAGVAQNIAIDVNDFAAQEELIKTEGIDLLVVGPEAPLVNGVRDYFQEKIPELLVVGPSKAGAVLEGSKAEAKRFMNAHDIPTAAYRSFDKNQIDEAEEFLSFLQPPYVLKADGLAAGKGVLIIDDIEEAKTELRSMLMDSKFGAASDKVVIEEYLSGIEMSTFVLTDGESYKVLPSAKDYKRIGEGDTGLNTGGMGAVSPVPFVDSDLEQKIEDRIIKRSVEGLKKEGIDYKGFLFIGLMIVKNEPFVIEYNVRMGDPETEVVMPRIASDILPLFKACAESKLDQASIEIDSRSATTVMLVSGGYPEDYEKGKVISGLDEVNDCIPFHAGTKQEGENILSSGGRVIAITAMGQGFKDALAKSYENAYKVDFEGRYFRRDIGFDL